MEIELQRIQETIDPTNSIKGQEILLRNLEINADDYINNYQNLSPEEQIALNKEIVKDILEESTQAEEEIRYQVLKELKKDLKPYQKLTVQFFSLFNETIAQQYKERTKAEIAKESSQKLVLSLERKIEKLTQGEKLASRALCRYEKQEQEIINDFFTKEAIMKSYSYSIKEAKEEIERMRLDQQACYLEETYENAKILASSIADLNKDIWNWDKKKDEAGIKMINYDRRLDRIKVNKNKAFKEAVVRQGVIMGLQESYENFKTTIEDNHSWSNPQELLGGFDILKTTQRLQKNLDDATEQYFAATKNLPTNLDLTQSISPELRSKVTTMEKEGRTNNNSTYETALKIADRLRSELYQ